MISAPPMTLPVICTRTGASGSATTMRIRWRPRTHLGWALWQMGRYGDARDLHEDTLERGRRVLGADPLPPWNPPAPSALTCTCWARCGPPWTWIRTPWSAAAGCWAPDPPATLASANNLAADLRALGEVQAARELDEDTLEGRRRVLGADHDVTLGSVNNLASDLRMLGEARAARDLHQATLDGYRRILGADHPRTLHSANNLAVDLRALGEVQAARKLDEDTLARRRRVLGADHPDTLISASGLAADLRDVREVQAVRELDEDTLARGRRILGEDLNGRWR